jgi:hypothetical protein
MKQRGVPVIPRVMLTAVVPIAPFLGEIYFIVGIFDVAFDLRKKMRGKSQ